jgi:hypothetical protein
VEGRHGDPVASTVNVQLSAARKLVSEARKNGLLSFEEAQNLTGISNIRQRAPGWGIADPRADQGATGGPDRSTLKGKRDYIILALLSVVHFEEGNWRCSRSRTSNCARTGG